MSLAQCIQGALLACKLACLTYFLKMELIPLKILLETFEVSSLILSHSAMKRGDQPVQSCPEEPFKMHAQLCCFFFIPLLYALMTSLHNLWISIKTMRFCGKLLRLLRDIIL